MPCARHLKHLCTPCRVGAETLLQVYGTRVDPHEFTAFAGMGEAHFLRGVAGKHGIVIEDIDALKATYYGIYLAKVKESNESIGLPGGLRISGPQDKPSPACAALAGTPHACVKHHADSRRTALACFAGAVELVRACRQAGLKTAVASSADRIKVYHAAWLAHRGNPQTGLDWMGTQQTQEWCASTCAGGLQPGVGGLPSRRGLWRDRLCGPI